MASIIDILSKKLQLRPFIEPSQIHPPGFIDSLIPSPKDRSLFFSSKEEPPPNTLLAPIFFASAANGRESDRYASSFVKPAKQTTWKALIVAGQISLVSRQTAGSAEL